tara:strand:- start:50 stop:646 length:597 start_codon:yes stop_codon:yes gene_type:complete
MKITKTQLKQIIKEELEEALNEEEYDDIDKWKYRSSPSSHRRIQQEIRRKNAKEIFDKYGKGHWDFAPWRGTPTWSGTLEQLKSLSEEDFLSITDKLADMSRPMIDVEIHVESSDGLARQEFRWPGTHAAADHYDYSNDPPALARIESHEFGENMSGFLQHVKKLLRPAGGGLGGPGGKARYPTRKEIEDAHRYEDNK